MLFSALTLLLAAVTGVPLDFDITKAQFLNRPGTGFKGLNNACSADLGCASGCCELASKVCKNLQSLKGNEQCLDMRMPFFEEGVGMVIRSDTRRVIGRLFLDPDSKIPTKDTVPDFKRTMVFQPCKADSECFTGCCENTLNICRNLATLTGSQMCKDTSRPLPKIKA